MSDMYDDDNRNGADDLADTGRDAINSVKNAKDVADGFKNLSSSAQKGASALSGGAKAAGSASVGASGVSAGAATAGTAGAAAGGGAVAAGAAAGGIGAVIVLAAMAAKKIASTDISSDGEGGTSLLGFIVVGLIALLSVIVVVLAPAIVVIYVVTVALGPMQGIAQEGLIGYGVHAVESYMEEQEMERYFEKIFGKEWHTAAETTREFSAETVEVCKDIVDYSIQRAYDKYVWEIIFSMETYKRMLFDGYNPYETYAKFKQARHPYSTRYITVQDYIDNYDKPGYENDDLNYAEFFTVLCQNEKFNYENFTYEEFFKTVVNKKTTKYLFELQVEGESFYKYTAGGKETLKQKKAEGIDSKNGGGSIAGQKLSNDQVNAEFESLTAAEAKDEKKDAKDEKDEEVKLTPIQQLISLGNDLITGLADVTDKVVKFFDRWTKNFFFAYDVTLKPYGLEELYKIADIRPDAPCKVNYTMRNIDMLDTQEALLRGVLIDSDLGPAFNEMRSRQSCIYNDLASMVSVSRTGVDYSIYGDPLVNYPTGRSAMSYVNESLVTAFESGDRSWEQFWMSFPESTTIPGMEFAAGPPNPEKATVVLNIPQYINQGYHGANIPRGEAGHGTVADFGCIDCAYYMIANYYWRGNLIGATSIEEYLKENSASVQKDEDGELSFPGYVEVDQFHWMDYCFDHDMYPYFFSIDGAPDHFQGPFLPNLVISFLSKGNPVVLHIEGVWEYNGIKYHNSLYNHYLLITGYDENGFFVHDPGNMSISDKDGTHDPGKVIPYEAFEGVSGKWIRAIEPEDGYDYSGCYKINTLGENND